MPETRYEERTDSVEEKIRMLQAAQRAGNDDLALSLAASIRDTVGRQRQERSAPDSPTLVSETFGAVSDLPSVWAQWARGWSYYKILALDETQSMERRHEPIDVPVA